jgi:general stress protein 26
MSGTEQQSRQNQPDTPKKLEDLYKLIDHMKYCMLTTRDEAGNLVSRAMQVQKVR